MMKEIYNKIKKILPSSSKIRKDFIYVDWNIQDMIRSKLSGGDHTEKNYFFFPLSVRSPRFGQGPNIGDTDPYSYRTNLILNNNFIPISIKFGIKKSKNGLMFSCPPKKLYEKRVNNHGISLSNRGIALEQLWSGRFKIIRAVLERNRHYYEDVTQDECLLEYYNKEYIERLECNVLRWQDTPLIRLTSQFDIDASDIPSSYYIAFYITGFTIENLDEDFIMEPIAL